MKACPSCGEQIQDVAKVCRFCGKILDPSLRKKKKRRKGEADIGRRIGYAIVWTFGFYFAVCMVAGFVVNHQVAKENPGNPNIFELAMARSMETGLRLGGYFFLGSAVVAGAGAWARVLPGTFRQDR